MSTDKKETTGKKQLSQAMIEALPAPELLHQTMVSEYEHEMARVDQLDNKAMALLTLVIALITVYVPIMPLGALGAYFAHQYLWEISTWMMFLFLGLGAAGLCVAFYCVVRLIGVYRTRDYWAINIEDLTLDPVIGCKLTASLQLLLVKHYLEVIQHNEKLNQEKVRLLCGQFRNVVILFALLSLSAIGTQICIGL